MEDEKARPQIVLNLVEEPATLVISLRLDNVTTKVMWDKLFAVYNKQNIPSKLNIRNQLQEIEFQEGNDLQDHHTKMEEIFFNLARMNDPVSMDEKMGIIVKALPES